MNKFIPGLCLFFSLGSAYAAEYLGFDLGVATKEKIAQQLNATNSPFEDNWGYRGYLDLTWFKVLGYEKFDKFGSVKESWLRFSPKGVLYQIQVTYNDAGETFKVLKDALDAKYGRATQAGMGFNVSYRYRDKKAEITLERNTFGFGNDQKTSLFYTWTPLVAEVKKMQAIIENDIQKSNAKKAGGDL